MADFTQLAKQLHPVLKKRGIPLNFTGYTEMWRAYLDFEVLDVEELLLLGRDCLLWSEYFENLHGLILREYLSDANKALYLESFYVLTPATHSKFPEVQQKYEAAQSSKQCLDLFKDQLLHQRTAFRRAHFDLMTRYQLLKEEEQNASFC